MVSDGPLWGRSLNLCEDCHDALGFQTDPCGVEAATAASRVSSSAAFQTDPCGVEAGKRSTTSPNSTGFRRTLVGSKRGRRSDDLSALSVSDGPLWGRSGTSVGPKLALVVFQTDPCGVEAEPITATVVTQENSFRRTLVGSKQEVGVGLLDRRGGFRRTLVGSKQRLDGRFPLLEFGFQTDPCGVEACPGASRPRASGVSDGPLWGRSGRGHARSVTQYSFRRTLVGSKPSEGVGGVFIRFVSDGPLWGRSPTWIGFRRRW